MSANSYDQFDLLAIEEPLPTWRLWLARFFFIGGLLGTTFCVYKGYVAGTVPKTVTKQFTIVEEVRRTTRMDEVKVGDTVLARDEFGNSVGPKKVTKVFRRTSDHLRLLTFEARDGTRQTVKTTDEHPFGLADSLDFLRAAQLEVGQVVPGPKGELQTLVASVREEHPEGIAVFNFEVEGAHTYFRSIRLWSGCLNG